MKDQPCETEPSAPTEITERNEEVDDNAHNDETAHTNIHNMRWENIETHFFQTLKPLQS